MIRRRMTILTVALPLLLAAFVPVVAQEGQSPFAGKKVIPLQPTNVDKVVLARKLVAAQRYQEAADLLEVLYETDSDNSLLLNLLRTCYDQLQQFDKAEMLMRRIIQKDPQSVGNRLYLAELLVRLNRDSEALEVYDQVEAMIGNGDPTRLILLINSMITSGLDKPVLERIDRAREKFGNPLLFNIELGGILEKQQDYRGAVLEYLAPLLQDTTEDANRAERRLLALLDFETSSAEVESLLKNVADSSSGHRAMRLLTEHYLKAERFDDAFAYALRQDSLEGRSGVPLLTLARRCGERHLWPQVVKMTDFILQRYPDKRYQTEVSFTRAQALAELGRADEAVQVYQRLAEQTDDQQVRADAIYGLGVLYSEYLDDCERALIYYDSVLNDFPRGRGYLMSCKAKSLCHIRLGYLDQARTLLDQLLKSRLPDDFREEVEFFQGLVEFFDQKYDTAQFMFRKLTVDFPNGLYVNDALRLVLALDDGKVLGSTLDDFSAARYAQFRGENDSALVRLYALADAKPQALGDLALYEVVEMELKRADTSAALAAIERLVQEYPDSYYRPLGMKIKADLLVGSGDNVSQATELYRFLLENCSEYPFTREVREKLKELDARRPVG
jgi:tetratricopeptide (TPR) repeat protein